MKTFKNFCLTEWSEKTKARLDAARAPDPNSKGSAWSQAKARYHEIKAKEDEKSANAGGYETAGEIVGFLAGKRKAGILGGAAGFFLGQALGRSIAPKKKS